MAQVTATTHRTIGADPGTVLVALADYHDVRPRILTEHYHDYRVDSGGTGEGTLAHWILQATKSRSRDQLVDVTSDASGGIVERDRNSSMVTIWTVHPEGQGRATVTVETRWNGASGVGGFFERLFAPKGLQRIHDGVLANLERHLTSHRDAPA